MKPAGASAAAGAAPSAAAANVAASKARRCRTGGPMADVPRRSAAGQTKLELAQKVGEPLALRLAEGVQQPALVGEVCPHHRVDELEARRRERDEDGAAVIRVRGAADEACLLEPVEALGRATRREHQRARELARPQPVGRPMPAQRRQHVVPAGLEPMLAIDAFELLLELAGESRDPSDDTDRRGIEVGALAAPLFEDDVDAVTFGHGESLQGSLVLDI